MKTLRFASLAFIAALCASSLGADVVQTKDGSHLVGKITGIADGTITLDTAYAGTVKIDQSKVDSFTTDEPLSLRTQKGTIMSGQVSAPAQGQVSIAGTDGSVTTDTTDISAAWTPGSRDPAVVAAEAALEKQIRKWSYEATVDISGKSGNSVESQIGMSAQAKLEGPSDRLRFYGSYHRASQQDPATGKNVTTADEAIGGVDFTSFFSEHWGWFIREELERDTFEGIDFRSSSAGGLSHRFWNTKTFKLEGRAGLSYRYESYVEPDPVPVDFVSSNGLIGAEFGATLYWKFAKWGELNTEVTYMPAFEDFGNYRATQKSTIDIPLADSNFWKLRFGLKNEYISMPPPDRKSLDTTYSLSLLMDWE